MKINRVFNKITRQFQQDNFLKVAKIADGKVNVGKHMILPTGPFSFCFLIVLVSQHELPEVDFLLA